jgi:hypothetical protein
MKQWWKFWEINDKTGLNIKEITKPKDTRDGPENLNERPDKEPLDRVRESIKEWGEAVNSVENPYMPIGIKRVDLFNLYRNIALDPHLFSITQTVYNRVRETPFKIFTGGEFNEEKTALFKRSWFSKFLKYMIEAENWGFSLIQFLGIKDGTFSDVTTINRFYIRPELKGVSKRMFEDAVAWSYETNPYYDWTMFVEGMTYLGRYNIVAKKFILKREVEQFWAVFNELYTTPYLAVKTEFNNSKHRNDLITSLQNRRHSGFQVLDIQDDIEAIPMTGAGYVSYKEFEMSADQAMSKAYIGSTMVTDNGSSYSQANVHEGNTKSFIHAFRIWIEEIVNEHLIPKMSTLGIAIDVNDVFKWELSEKLSVKDWAEIIGIIAPLYDTDEKQISEKIGIDVTEKAAPVEPVGMQQKIKAYYDNILNKS